MKTRIIPSDLDVERWNSSLIYVPGCGPDSELLIVGEAPGGQEEEAVKLGLEDTIMVGPTGALGDQFIRNASGGKQGLRDFYRTNVEKYRPPYNKLSNFKLIGRKPFQDIATLWEEIDARKPNAILAFGGHALQALTGKKGITKYRGSILNSIRGNYKVIPTFHPASFLHSGKEGEAQSFKASHWVTHDIKRALEESRTSELSLPKRVLEVCKSSGQLKHFIAKYRDKRRFCSDIEVIRAVPTCIGLAFSSDHGISIPLLDVADIHIPDDESAEIYSVLAAIFLDPSFELVGQNWKFDEKKLRSLFGFRFACKFWMDTAIAAHTLYPEFPKKLEFLTSIFTREPYYKGELKEFDPSKEPYENILLYNAKDVAVPFEIHEKLESELEERGLTHFFHEFAMPLHDLYRQLEGEGVYQDQIRRVELWRKYTTRASELQEQLNELAGKPINVRSSVKDIPWFLAHLGLPSRKSYNEDNLVQLLGNHAKKDYQKLGIDIILTLRKVKRVLSAYLAADPDYDGRMRTLVNVNGTETGRTSDNILKPPERPHKVGLPFKILSKHGDIGPEIQEMLLPDVGYGFLEIDSSQAEARVVALIAEDFELLKLFDSADVHRMTAGWFFFKDPSEISEDERFIGKTGRHAIAYKEMKHRLMLTINSDARRFGIKKDGITVSVSEKDCAGFIDVFHKKSPRIRDVFWPKIERALIDNKRIITNPFGRQRWFSERWDDALIRGAIANFPQSTIGDNTKSAFIRIKKRLPAARVFLESHDALKLQVPINDRREVAEICKEEFERPIDFSRSSIPCGELSIPCEMKWGTENLRNLKDLYKKGKWYN